MPPKLFGQGTIRLPVTGAMTTRNGTTQVGGTLVIGLEQDAIQPKQDTARLRYRSCKPHALEPDLGA